MSIRIGITGGIGSGKSVISHLLGIMGIPVYISDEKSKELTNTDETIRQKLCELLGDEVYCDGILNKALLASYIFGHPEHINTINKIIHPRIKDDFHSWVEACVNKKIVGIESAILIEAGFENEVDVIVMVYAPIEVRIKRAMKRDQALREQILKRVQSQMDDEEKIERADFVILNDGQNPLIPQVLNLISSLSKNNHYLCSAKK